MNWIENELELRKAQGLFRSLKTIKERKGLRIVINNRTLVNFCSNNYSWLGKRQSE